MDREYLDELRELIEFLRANAIAEFDMERSDVKLRIKFAGAAGSAGVEVSRTQEMMAPVMTAGAAVAPTHIASEAATTSPIEELLHEVKSPIVGTFYESPAPGAAAFVKIGDMVEAGQVLCIVEAMKLMNEIEADVAGEVVKRIAVTGQPVEYGQPLFAVRPR